MAGFNVITEVRTCKRNSDRTDRVEADEHSDYAWIRRNAGLECVGAATGSVVSWSAVWQRERTGLAMLSRVDVVAGWGILLRRISNEAALIIDKRASHQVFRRPIAFVNLT
jgi:hypothetical protein